MSLIRIKPHHLVDILRTLGAEGRGAFQPHLYGHDLHVVAEMILSRPDVLLQMEIGIDDICQPCVHHINGGCDDTIDISFRPDAPESKEAWNLLIDRRWCQTLDLEQGDRITALQFCQRVLAHSDQMTGIYRELPADHIAKRREEVVCGIDEFLSRPSTL